MILRKATDLQQETGSGTGEGLSLVVLAEIAREIGVDPEFVKQAAITLADRSAARSAFWGGPSIYDASLTSSRQLSRDELLQLIDVVRGATQHQGSVQDVLGSLEWKTSGEVSEIAVTARAQEQGTQIRVIVNREGAAGLTWGLSVAGALAAGGITGAILEPATVLGGIGLMATAGTVGFGLGRTLWAGSTRRFQQRFTRLREELSRYLKEVDDRP